MSRYSLTKDRSPTDCIYEANELCSSLVCLLFLFLFFLLLLLVVVVVVLVVVVVVVVVVDILGFCFGVVFWSVFYL